MGFYLGILMKSPPPWGVHKLMILLRDLVKDILLNIFGEENGGGQGDPDPKTYRSCFRGVACSTVQFSSFSSIVFDLPMLSRLFYDFPTIER